MSYEIFLQVDIRKLCHDHCVVTKIMHTQFLFLSRCCYDSSLDSLLVQSEFQHS